MNTTPYKCFACDKPIKEGRNCEAWTSDPQMQWVGSDCFKRILGAGANGFRPRLGGPRLYANQIDAERASNDN